MSNAREPSSRTASLSQHVLNVYHGRVDSLLDYIVSIADISTHLVFAHLAYEEKCTALHRFLIDDVDPPQYRNLMSRALVAETSGQSKRMVKISTPSSSMAELIDRAHARLFTRSHKPSNVITAGYRSAELRSEIGKGGAAGARQGISNFFVNTQVTALQAPEWTLLLKRVGDAIILHLLAETSMYIALPNDCYCQLTGPPLIYNIPPQFLLPTLKHLERADALDCPTSGNYHSRKRKATDSEPRNSLRQLKRRRKDPEVCHLRNPGARAATLIDKNQTATMVPISRTAMFYARPYRKRNGGQIILGLPPDHVLNAMMTESWCTSKGLPSQDSDDKNDSRPGDQDGAFQARHLSKYVFPLQYSLRNMFSLHRERLRDHEARFTMFRFKNKEEEIKMKGPCKTPTRLKSMLPLLGQLYRRHRKCGYKALLNAVCPSKLKPDHKDQTAGSSSILELISEELSGDFLQTQMNLTSGDWSSLSMPSKERRRDSGRGRTGSASKSQIQATLKPKFAEFTCSVVEVYLYVCAVTRAVIPSSVWGCERNRRTVLHHAKQLIIGRRHEGMTLHNVMQGISTSECDWLLPPGRPSQLMRQTEAEMLKRRELLQELIFWYFDQFLIALLRTTFYITDSSAYRNRVLYFRQDDWDVLCQPLLDRLAASTFERIHEHEAEELLQQRKLGYSFVRLLPKDSGVRPIVNLRRKAKALTNNPYEQGRSINQILSATFQILKYEMGRFIFHHTVQKEKLGASVFGPDDVYLRLKQFKNKLVNSNGKMPKLYFVKLDVQACFDTIEQSKLLGILKDLITEDVYMVQRFGQVTPSTSKIQRIQRNFVRNAMPDYEHPHFLTHATRLAALLKNAIFVDQVVYPFSFRDETIQLLEDHITSNIVKIGNDYYRQRVGIPQGSVLSTLLCSFFYGDLERNALRFVTDATRENVLLRLVDDYLFITTDVTDARHFLQVMSQGHPEYGCSIARDKTLTNFVHNVGDISQFSLSTVLHPDRKLFPWCGYLINTEDLSVMADYSRFHSTYLTDSLTVERCRRPNAVFLTKMLQTSKAKTHPIFTDAAHNSKRAVRMNVYHAFVLTAMKMHMYVRSARESGGGLAFVPGLAPQESSSKTVKRKRCVISERKDARGAGAFLLSAIRQCIRYTYSSIRNKASARLARESGARFEISRDEVFWLGLHAFHNILTLKHTAYVHAGVLPILRAQLVHPRYHPVKRRLAGVAREGLKDMLRDIRF